MYHYRIYGKRLESDFEFPQLVKLSAEEKALAPELVIVSGKIPEEYKFDRVCYSKVAKDISYLSNASCYLLIENGNRITYEQKPGALPFDMNAYLLGWGLAMLFYQRNMPAIHCSCVAKEDGAVLISGDSGSGKSTITAFLLEKGYSLMADDMSVIELTNIGTALAAPAFPYQKLCRDTANNSGLPLEEMVYIDEDRDKFLVPYSGEFRLDLVPIRAIIMLSCVNGEEVLSGEVTGIQKLYACMDALFLKPLLKEGLYQAENAELCLKLASGVPIYYIARPNARNSKEEVFKAVEEICRQSGVL